MILENTWPDVGHMANDAAADPHVARLLQGIVTHHPLTGRSIDWDENSHAVRSEGLAVHLRVGTDMTSHAGDVLPEFTLLVG